METYLLRVASSDENVLNEALRLTLCATAKLPDYLAFESKPRVALLAGGVIQPKPSQALLTFNGLSFSAGGIDKPDDTQLSTDEDCTKKAGLKDVNNVSVVYDCRAWGGYPGRVTMGPLSLSSIQLNLVARVRDADNNWQLVPPTAPQFHFRSDVSFAKYLSSDGPAGTLTADFDHKHMVMLGDFKKPVTVHAGIVTLGLQGFQMDLDATQRKFVANGASIAGESTGVNSTALYFKTITFLETNEGTGWHLKKLSAPVDVPKTALGLAYRLFSDLGASSFLRLFKLR